MARYPRTIEKNIMMIGPYQYRVQIRKKGYSIATQTFEAFDDALAYRDKILMDIRRGEYKSSVEAKHTTLGDVLQRYASEVVPKVTTEEKYARQLKSRLLKIKSYAIGDVALSELDVIHLQSFRDIRRSEGRKRKTLKEDLSEIKRVIEYARHEWHIYMPKGNPVDVKLLLLHIANDAKKRRPIKSEGLEAVLLKACSEYGDKHTLHDVVELGLKTGMRRGQLVHLLWENIYLDESIAYVVNKDRKTDNESLVGIPLSSAAVSVLKRVGVKPSGKVFCYTSPDTVTKAIARIRAKDEYKDIPDFEFITPHVLRHTVVHKLKKAGVSKEVAKLVTGHKTDQMYGHYGKLDASDIAGSVPDF